MPVPDNADKGLTLGAAAIAFGNPPAPMGRTTGQWVNGPAAFPYSSAST